MKPEVAGQKSEISEAMLSALRTKLESEKDAGDPRAATALRVLKSYPARMEGVAYPGRLMDGPDDKPFLFFLGGPVVVASWSVS